MKLSKNGLDQIVKREGVILHAYKDTVGVWTIGTGHTSAAGPPKVVPGMKITREENDRILRQDLAPIEKQVNETVKVPITQNQYDAIVSIIFNVGPKFLKSTCMKRLNAKDYKGAAEAIMLWNKPPEIIGRRATEKKQFLAPDVFKATVSDAALTTTVSTPIGGALVATNAPHSTMFWVGVVLLGVAAISGCIWLYNRIKGKKVPADKGLHIKYTKGNKNGKKAKG